jgi:hypothetical protein
MSPRSARNALCYAAFAALLGGCQAEGEPTGPGSTRTDDDPAQAGDAGPPGSAGQEPNAGFARSTKPSLQWKRYAAFEADLAGALSLPKDELCKEFGRENCIRGVHLSPLGGHDPFGAGLLESSAEPLATTPTVVERIVLSACVERVKRDREAGPEAAEVFKGLDLAKAAPAPADAAVQAVVTQLYRRFLARDPSDEERAIVAGLAASEQGAPVSATTFAHDACFAVGTTSEFLFF